MSLLASIIDNWPERSFIDTGSRLVYCLRNNEVEHIVTNITAQYKDIPREEIITALSECCMELSGMQSRRVLIYSLLLRLRVEAFAG